MTANATSSPATVGEGVAVTVADLAWFKNIVHVFEQKFEAWYVTKQLNSDSAWRNSYYLSADKMEEWARTIAKGYDCYEIDADGIAVFRHLHEEHDTVEMPFSVIMGTAQARALRQEELRVEAYEKRRLAYVARHTEVASQRAEELAEEAAKRDRIFREEAAKRGIAVPE